MLFPKNTNKPIVKIKGNLINVVGKIAFKIVVGKQGTMAENKQFLNICNDENIFNLNLTVNLEWSKKTNPCIILSHKR